MTFLHFLFHLFFFSFSFFRITELEEEKAQAEVQLAQAAEEKAHVEELLVLQKKV